MNVFTEEDSSLSLSQTKSAVCQKNQTSFISDNIALFCFSFDSHFHLTRIFQNTAVLYFPLSICTSLLEPDLKVVRYTNLGHFELPLRIVLSTDQYSTTSLETCLEVMTNKGLCRLQTSQKAAAVRFYLQIVSPSYTILRCIFKNMALYTIFFLEIKFAVTLTKQ